VVVLRIREHPNERGVTTKERKIWQGSLGDILVSSAVRLVSPAREKSAPLSHGIAMGGMLGPSSLPNEFLCSMLPLTFLVSSSPSL
jgi:hypothetical protein